MSLFRSGKYKNLRAGLTLLLVFSVVISSDILFSPQPAHAATTVIFLTTTSATTWTVPSDWNSSANTIEVIGGGGAGEAGADSSAEFQTGGGGGGGAYSKVSNASLTPGASVDIAVGAGGSTVDAAGGDTYLCSSTSGCSTITGGSVVVGAKGGGGAPSDGTAGVGGVSSSGVGSIKFSGGTGGTSIPPIFNTTFGGGGGGGAAGPNGNGGNGGINFGENGDAGAGGGGGNGGGASGAAASSTSFVAGGPGGNNSSGTGAGAAAFSGSPAVAGMLGGGGGGGANFTSDASGAAGGAGAEFDLSHGSGGGGGGASQGSGGSIFPGNGALYGAGGGGSGQAGINFGLGAQGLIVITYTPIVATAPTVTTSAASSVTGTTATFNGTITATGGANATQSGFAYGTSSDLSSVIATSTLGSQSGAVSFTQNITGLSPTVTYYVRAYATNSAGTSFGSIQSFTTGASAPSVTTSAASSLTDRSALLNGNITSTGGSNATAEGFAYGTTAAYGATTTSSGSFGTGAFSASASGLACVTTYHFASFATNGAGTTYSSDATFTTGSCVAPVISSIAANTSTPNAATITWTTDEVASSLVSFGPTTFYGSSTVEADTSPRVTSHSVSLSNLASCSVYHYEVGGSSVALLSATSTDQSLNTTGCTGGATIQSSTDSTVATSTGGTVTNGEVALTVPAAFASSTITFQANQIASAPFFATAGTPSGVTAASSPVYTLTAFVNASTTVSTFSTPLTVTFSYIPSDVSNLIESSLAIYRLDGATWTELSNCVVDTTANTVSCQTSNFSTFAIFGTAAPVVSSGGGGGGAPVGLITGSYVPPSTITTTTSVATSTNTTGTTILSGSGGTTFTIGEQNQTVLELQYYLVLKGYLLAKYETGYFGPITQNALNLLYAGASTSPAPILSVKEDLSYGMTSSDVKVLQQFLNGHGYVIAATGPGSPGDESTYFGTLTMRALAKFQKDHGVSATGYFGPLTRAAIAMEL